MKNLMIFRGNVVYSKERDELAVHSDSYIAVEDGRVEGIYEKLPEKYRDKLVTLKHDVNWVSYSYLPVFDTDTQAEWDKEFEEFMETKSRWCREYGCD